MSLFQLSLISIIFTISNANCIWGISGYGTVNLTPLNNELLVVTRNNAEAFKLNFTPCDNKILCEMSSATATAMATQMGPNNDDNCNGVISKWDSGRTTPHHEINENDEHQIVFTYPVQETISGAGCTEGRKGEFIFVCDENADPYNDPDFWQEPGSNPCYYHTVIRTKYACATNEPIPGEEDTGMSGGWVFIINLLVGISAYCLIGYLINGFKSKNWSDITGNLPQCLSFWIFLPRLVKTGCIVSYQWVLGKAGRDVDIDTSELTADNNDDNF